MPTLGPRYGDQVPHPLHRQDILKTTPFRRQKRRFLDGARLQEFWLRRAVTGGECFPGPWKQA